MENSEEESDESLDSETGERKTRILYRNVIGLNTDAETGEPKLIDIIVKRKTFQIPLQYLKQPYDGRGHRTKARSKKYLPEFYHKKSSRVQSSVFKAVLLSDKQRMSPLVFVLPTLLIFPTWASILCLLWEACMHIWSHRRNRKRKNRQVEYRSPLHLLSSQFCIHCRTRKWKEKISEIHDKRTLRRKLKKQKHIRRLTT